MRAGERRLTWTECVLYALVLLAWVIAAMVFGRESLQGARQSLDGAGGEAHRVVTAVESDVQHVEQAWRESFE
jgi:hypothetical protein